MWHLSYWSGVLTVLFYGILISHYTWHTVTYSHDQESVYMIFFNGTLKYFKIHENLDGSKAQKMDPFHIYIPLKNIIRYLLGRDAGTLCYAVLGIVRY